MRGLRNTKRVQRSLDARTHFKRSSPGLKLNKVKQNPNSELIKKQVPASLVAQWLRICLPMQGTRVRALVWEDPTCRGVTRPVSHNY